MTDDRFRSSIASLEHHQVVMNDDEARALAAWPSSFLGGELPAAWAAAARPGGAPLAGAEEAGAVAGEIGVIMPFARRRCSMPERACRKR